MSLDPDDAVIDETLFSKNGQVLMFQCCVVFAGVAVFAATMKETLEESLLQLLLLLEAEKREVSLVVTMLQMERCCE